MSYADPMSGKPVFKSTSTARIEIRLVSTVQNRECIWEMEYAVGNMRWECAAAFPAGASMLRDLRLLLALAIPPPSSDTLIFYTTSSRDNELYTNTRY